MNNKYSEKQKHIKAAKNIGILFLVSTAATMTYGFLTANKIPKYDDVDKWYAAPSKLEIKVEDLANNGRNETVLSYNGKKYLLTLDKKGNPEIDTYEISRAGVIPKEIRQ